MRQRADAQRGRDADLRDTFHTQGYIVTGLLAVYQVVEHFGLHYGQRLHQEDAACSGFWVSSRTRQDGQKSLTACSDTLHGAKLAVAKPGSDEHR